jgi:hypothetical protein
MSILIGPGAYAFTVMPCGASSPAHVFVSETTAAFVAEYSPRPIARGGAVHGRADVGLHRNVAEHGQRIAEGRQCASPVLKRCGIPGHDRNPTASG